MPTTPDQLAEILGELSTYNGQQVTGTTLTLSNTGHGLEESVEIEPVVITIDGTAYVLFEAELMNHQHKKNFDKDGVWLETWTLVQRLKAHTCLVLDDEAVGALRETLKARKERIELEREQRRGVARLPLETEEERNLRGDHVLGQHPEPESIEGCPACAERDALIGAHIAQEHPSNAVKGCPRCTGEPVEPTKPKSKRSRPAESSDEWEDAKDAADKVAVDA